MMQLSTLSQEKFRVCKRVIATILFGQLIMAFVLKQAMWIFVWMNLKKQLQQEMTKLFASILLKCKLKRHLLVQVCGRF